MLGLIDSTLREGSQTSGVFFSLKQKMAIASAVAAIGIEELELGVATCQDPDLPALVAACRELKHRPRLALWCRCRAEDIELAASLKPDILSLSLPASDLHIRKRLNKTRRWVLAHLQESVQLAKASGIKKISLGIEDSSRANRQFLNELIAEAVSVGVGRIRFADTVGIMTPNETSDLIRFYKQRYPTLELAFHGHNDFGLATANALSALEAGADWVDVTVLGLGERAGCARLEELVGMLTLVKSQKKYAVDQLSMLCTLVAESAGRSIEGNHPLVGSAIFTCESGLHVHGLLADPASYEPFPPELVRSKRTVLLGAKSGGKAVDGYCARLGISPGSSLPALVSMVRQRATELGRPLLDSEIRCLA
ncbi:MAG: pyruvate carboxyltransferase [Desulfobulbaceae bacterium]|nr:pyruvate carboxyltransferase [Desulfobulbaceae bacterium]